MTGHDIVAAAEQLVITALAAAPHGLTNAEVGEKTHLNLDIKGHRGYITWTILQHLLQSGRVQKKGKAYLLRAP